MTQERWKDILGRIKDNFPVLEEGKEELEEDGGAHVEFIVFNGPMGKMRLEFISRPVVLDKKTIYSKRIGSETKVEYVYSENERNYKLAVYKWNEDNEDWSEMESKKFNI
jgi:hypothetical protein